VFICFIFLQQVPIARFPVLVSHKRNCTKDVFRKNSMPMCFNNSSKRAIPPKLYVAEVSNHTNVVNQSITKLRSPPLPHPPYRFAPRRNTPQADAPSSDKHAHLRRKQCISQMPCPIPTQKKTPLVARAQISVAQDYYWPLQQSLA
jgi:hypothetical protein